MKKVFRVLAAVVLSLSLTSCDYPNILEAILRAQL